MKDILSKLKDFLVLAVSFEVNIILTLILFQTKISDYLWTVLKVNVALVILYLWLWFVEFYLANYSTAALLDKKIKLKEMEKEIAATKNEDNKKTYQMEDTKKIPNTPPQITIPVGVIETPKVEKDILPETTTTQESVEISEEEQIENEEKGIEEQKTNYADNEFEDDLPF